jgi:hypothetical protein
MRRRDSFSDVGAAVRLTVERAVAADLGVGDWRVLGAVLSLSASWSRLTVAADAPQIAELAGMSVRRTRDRLKRLAAEAVIVWTPRPGTRPDGKPRSVVGLANANVTPIASALKPDAHSVRFEGDSKQDAQAGSNRTPIASGTTRKREEELPVGDEKVHAETVVNDEAPAATEGHVAAPLVAEGSVSSDGRTMQAKAIDAYLAVGGKLNSRSKGALVREAAAAAKEGIAERCVLAAAAELARADAFPATLRKVARRIAEEGLPCKWRDFGRLELSDEQLRECGCSDCLAFVAFKESTAAVAA